MPEAIGSTRPGPAGLLTRSGLRADLARLGLRAGDTVMVHAALRRVGRVLGGPDALIGAVLDATQPDGTVLAYTDWGAYDDVALDVEGRVRNEWRDHLAPFDPSRSRAARGNGALPELLRTWPEAHRSANPGASVAAVGARAAWLCADHPLDYGYALGSPLAKLVAVDGRVLMLGAPLDTMTLLHHAEHLARLPNKRVVRYEMPLVVRDEVRWRLVEEFDTAAPVVAGAGRRLLRHHRHRLPRNRSGQARDDRRGAQRPRRRQGDHGVRRAVARGVVRLMSRKRRCSAFPRPWHGQQGKPPSHR